MIEVSDELREMLAAAARMASQIREQITQAVNALQNNPEVRRTAAMFAVAAADISKSHRIEAAGWLPHQTMPFSRIEGDAGGPENDSLIIESFYRDEWPAVRQEFEASLRSYDLDDEAKATFVEAMDAHENGLYRCVGRVLFPEIERLARDHFARGNIKARITSMHEAIRAVEDTLSIMDFRTRGFSALTLLHRFVEHVYVKVDSEQAFERFRRDPIPNRHAALHGLVSYSSHQTSINALIMGDFVYQVISALRKDSRESEALPKLVTE